MLRFSADLRAASAAVPIVSVSIVTSCVKNTERVAAEDLAEGVSVLIVGMPFKVAELEAVIVMP